MIQRAIPFEKSDLAKSIRAESGLTVREMAFVLGVSTSVITAAERGRNLERSSRSSYTDLFLLYEEPDQENPLFNRDEFLVAFRAYGKRKLFTENEEYDKLCMQGKRDLLEGGRLLPFLLDFIRKKRNQK